MTTIAPLFSSLIPAELHDRADQLADQLAALRPQLETFLADVHRFATDVEAHAMLVSSQLPPLPEATNKLLRSMAMQASDGVLPVVELLAGWTPIEAALIDLGFDPDLLVGTPDSTDAVGEHVD